MGKGKRKQATPEPEPDDDEALPLGSFFDGTTILEEDEEGYEDEEDEEDDRQGHFMHHVQHGNGSSHWGGQQQNQKGGGQQQQYQKGGQQQQYKGGGQQKGNKNNHNQGGGQRNQQNQKGQKGQKGQNQKGQKGAQQQQNQEETTWGGGGGNAPGWGNNTTDWGGNDVVSNDWGVTSAAATGWGADNGDGGEVWGTQVKSAAGSSTHPLNQQRRLASLLNQQWTPPGAERGRQNTNQSHGRSRPPTAAENIKAAANGRTPSRTLLYATTGSAATSVLDGGARGGPHTTVQIHDSGGAALEEANRALYGPQRPASQRIHWMFSPTKDDRVASLLDWVQAMSHGLATLGLHHFLRSQQRGALVTNADFRPWKAPNEPAFDWVTFNDVVETHDRTLQESIAFYDPEIQVLIFVFLLSRSGNSVAMWRRKLAVPNGVRKQNRSEIARITTNLAEQKVVITVDELPPPPAKPKKKWFNVRW